MGKVTEYYGADIRPWEKSRILRSGYPPSKISRSGADFFWYVTGRSGADIRSMKSHGFSRSGYPPSKTVTDFCERISVIPVFSRSGLPHSVEQTAQNRGISPRCTVAISVKTIRLTAKMIRISANKYQQGTEEHVVSGLLRAQPRGSERPAPGRLKENGAHVNVAFLEKKDKTKNVEY